MPARIPLTFLYRWARRDMGSSLMRVDQLSRHMEAYFGDRYEVRRRPIASSRRLWVQAWLAAQPAGGIYLFSKDALRGWRPDDLERLRQRATAVLVDYVDLKLRDALTHGVDAHVCTSLDGTAAMKKKQAIWAEAGTPVGGSVHTVLHNYDTLIDSVQIAPPNHLSIGFLGAPNAAAMTPAIAAEVEVLRGNDRATFAANTPRIGRFNCHYCVRVASRDKLDRSYRPFTKGITAAACGAVILTNRGCDDALSLLGDSYPYMAQDIAPATLENQMRFVKETYGGPVWKDALDHVMQLRARTTHKAICTQLHDVIEAVAR